MATKPIHVYVLIYKSTILPNNFTV